MANYDLSAAFEAIEDELISSMINNLKRHRAEETERGYQWEQWQTLQLKALEDYRRQNQKKFPQRFNKLNNQIREVLQDSYNDGSTKQERKILQAIKHGFKGEPGTNAPSFTGQAEIEGNFFVTNDRKLDALITSTTHDVQKAEYSVLRQADDQYRQIIFNAQVYANTGAGTYEKAVDMATKDFLRAGINSIQYKNGSRHTIEDYADMAIKTAAKRAYLQGEGAKRKEYGVPTVILNKRSCPCPLCLPFVGKVFIDDVWSGGDSSGISPITGLEYPLLSEAIAQGLYHPRCRDSHSTYFEGINTAPEDSEYTADELDEIAQKYQAQQKQAYCERQEKCYSRMAEYSLDDDNKRIYAARANEWNSKVSNFRKSSENIFSKNIENLDKNSIIKPEQLNEFKVEMSKLGVNNLINFENYQGDFEVLREMIIDYSKLKQKFPKIFCRFKGISYFEQKIDEYASFNPVTNMFNFNNIVYNDTKLLKSLYEEDVFVRYHPQKTTYRANVFHEFGHYVEYIADINPKKLAKLVYQKQTGRYFTRKMGDDWIVQGLSTYASEFDYGEYIAECFAEYFESKAPRAIALDTIDEIFKILLKKGLL